MKTHRCKKLQIVCHDFRNMFQVAVRFLHVELLAEAQVAEDIKDQVVDLVGHVERP
jgi:hypothetical protein